ncbi:hypothetical protein lerEdw1_014415 [Lerista edwardsae]|nr:hypothetical protein lerEdw1_014415 [Lerista edwardsae]
MIPEEESPPGGEADGEGDGGFPLLLQPSESGSVLKGCDPLAQTQRSKLQHRRARINQQINKEMRMRAGAENLFRATSNHKVKETVALELSYVNSNLQLLKEELEELNSCMDVYQNDSDSISVPMIPLGLKETKELDWAAPLKVMEPPAEQRTQAGQWGIPGTPGHQPLSGTSSAVLTSSPLPLALQVEEVYSLVHQSMSQPHVKDYVPFSWVTMVHVKAEHFRALSHYYAAMALCDCPASSEADLPDHEKAFLQFHVAVWEGPSLHSLLQDQEEKRKLGKAHLRKAIMRHEEAMRIHGLCKILRKMDILQEVLCLAHKRSLSKYLEIDHEEDFFETADAPDIHRKPVSQQGAASKTHQRAEINPPNFSKVKVTDIFHRLGPLSVFSAKNKWHLPRLVHLVPGESGFGFTLRGDSPVLIAGVVTGGCAAGAGLKEGDYIVSIDGKDCRWSKHAEVVQLLKVVGDEGAEVGVIALLPPDGQSTVEKKSPALSLSAGSLLWSNKENRQRSLVQSRGPSTLLAWGKRSKRSKSSSSSPPCSLPFAAVGGNALAC